MSLELAYSVPAGVTVKTMGLDPSEPVSFYLPGNVAALDLEISMAEFCEVVLHNLASGEGSVEFPDGLVAAWSKRTTILSRETEGTATIDERDWPCVIEYVLSNTNLRANDPRLRLVQKAHETPGPLANWLASYKVIEGWPVTINGQPMFTLRLSFKSPRP